MAIDFKEYSRLRSIARKRIERAAAAGLMPIIKLPTVKEARASDYPELFMSAVRNILSAGSTVQEIRKTGTAPVVELPQLPNMPKMPKDMSPEEKRIYRNTQKRRSKAKRAVELAAPTPEKARKRAGYLKALETLGEKWREKGVDIGHWLTVMSPGMAKQFVEYIEYRFSQGDYNTKYVIDTFIKDFGEMRKREYDFTDIQKDFDAFLEKQKKLKKGKKRTKDYGIQRDFVMDAWKKFATQKKIAKG